VWIDETPRDLIGTHISHSLPNVTEATEEQVVLLKKIAQDSARLMLEQRITELDNVKLIETPPPTEDQKKEIANYILAHTEQLDKQQNV